MKKILIVMSLIFSVVLFSNYIDQTTAAQAKKVPFTIKDFFCFEENTKYVYEGQGNEYATYNIIVEYLTKNRVQLRSNNGGTEMIKVLENKDGKLTMLLSKTECYDREDLTQNPSENEEILLQEPLVTGTVWNLADNRKRYISNVEREVITPLGKYKTIEVTTEGEEYKIVDYYAENIGLVKTIFISNGNEISSSLSKIEKAFH